MHGNDEKEAASRDLNTRAVGRGTLTLPIGLSLAALFTLPGAAQAQPPPQPGRPGP